MFILLCDLSKRKKQTNKLWAIKVMVSYDDG